MSTQPSKTNGRARFAPLQAVREGNRRWEETYVTAEQAAEYLGFSRPDQLGKLIAAGLLQPYRRAGSERRLFLRSDVESLIQPSNEKAPARGVAKADGGRRSTAKILEALHGLETASGTRKVGQK